MTTQYTRLSLIDMRNELQAVARHTSGTFGQLDERQLNWRQASTSWSVAQCFEHLLKTNNEMFEAIDRALDDARPRTLWQRVPWLPGLFGPMLIRSQAPESKKKYPASVKALPAASAIDAGIIPRFVAAQGEVAARMDALAGRDTSRIVMVSPFAAFITYSVLDGFRLIVAHERRHFEQARRVTEAPGFPK